jgi:hypothetical protein
VLRRNFQLYFPLKNKGLFKLASPIYGKKRKYSSYLQLSITMYKPIFILFLMTALIGEHCKAQNIDIPGIGNFLSFSDGMSTWEGDHCSIDISQDGTISTNSHVWSGPKCDYISGERSGKTSKESLQKFAELLGQKGVLMPYIKEGEDDQGGKSSKQYTRISTSKGDYTLNFGEGSEKVWDMIWKMRCEAGLEDEAYLISDKTYFQKLAYCYPNQPGKIQDYFVLLKTGECAYNEVKGKIYSSGGISNFSYEEIKQITAALKADKTKKVTTLSYDQVIASKNTKPFHLVYTNKEVYEITNKATLDVIWNIYSSKKH